MCKAILLFPVSLPGDMPGNQAPLEESCEEHAPGLGAVAGGQLPPLDTSLRNHPGHFLTPGLLLHLLTIDLIVLFGPRP